MRKVCPKLRSIFVFLVSVFGGSATADEPADYQRRWTRMLYVENSIREVDVALAKLEVSLLNLQLPTEQARALFTDEVAVTDLVSTSPGASSQLGAISTAWSTGTAGRHQGDSLAIWRQFLGNVKYLKYAELRIADARFTNRKRLALVATVSFAALARTDSGLRHATAKLELTFQRSSVSQTDWRISRWETKSFGTTDRENFLFEESLDKFAAPSTVASLRRSRHEELAAKLIGEKTRDKKGTSRPFPEFDVSSWIRHPGLSVVDFDGDGNDDIFITRRVGQNTLLRNGGNGQLHDVTEKSALTTDSSEQGFTNAALFADFDNDGDQDAFVGRSLYRSRYYTNEGGKFLYTPEAFSEPLPAHVVSISAVDYNNDGLLDVYLSRYMPTANGFNFELHGLKKRTAIAKLLQSNRLRLTKAESREFAKLTWNAQSDLYRDAPGLPNVLLKNVGAGRFEVAPEGKALELWRPTYQATWADYDGDGDSDVYVANDFSPNHLLRNDDGEFTDVTASTGTADNGFGMGASWGDYNGDGQLDLYVTNMSSKAGRRITRKLGPRAERFVAMARGNSLFRQEDGVFVRASGVTPDKLRVENAGWGWGSQFVDVDNDGYLDLFAPAGYYTAPRSVSSSLDT